MVEPIESKRRSRTTLIAVTVGVVVAAGLVAYGFSRSDDDRDLDSDTPPTIGVIQAPADVLTTQGVIELPVGSTPGNGDVQVLPPGTADVAFPPISSDILVP